MLSHYKETLQENKQFKIGILFLCKYTINLWDSHPHEAKGHPTVQGIYQQLKNSLNLKSIDSEKAE